MGRDVAIKLLQPKISGDDTAQERFRREARHASTLHHPHTITLHDYGQDDEGAFYIVMELLEGTVLGKAIFKGGGLQLGRALRIGSQVLKSLGDAHRKGLVHRDLKPENIFLLSDVLGEQDYVKVLDFGLSKAVSAQQSTYDEPTLTQHGKVFGTPYYMSPEQAYGDEVTPAADVFAFGLLFYEMLVGRRPFRGKTAFDVLTKLTKEPLPRLPEPLGTSCIQRYLDVLTAKDLKGRYDDGVAALVPLEALLAGEAHAELGDIEAIYVGKRRGPRASASRAPRVPAAAPVAPPTPTPPPPPPRPPEAEVGLFAPEELAASMEHIAHKPDRHPRLVMELEPDEQTIVRSDSRGPLLTGRRMPSPAAVKPATPAAGRHGMRDRNVATVIHRHALVDSDEGATVVRQASSIFWNDVPLFGRESELSSLMLSAQRVRNKSGGLLVIEGEAGIGKSRLITELQARLEGQGPFRVLRGSYAEGGGGGFGAGLRDAIEQALGIKGIDDGDAVAVAGRRFAQLGIHDDVQILLRLLRPWLSSDEGAWFNMGAVPTAYGILETVLLRAAREHPLVVVLEDIQWADPLMTGFAEHLVRSVAGQLGPVWPLLLICTQRHDEIMANADLSTAISNIGRALGRSFAHLRLKPLTETTVHALTRQVMELEPKVRMSLASVSRGNPFFVLQGLRFLDMLRSMEDAGMIRRGSLVDPRIPGSVAGLVHERIELLSKSHRGHALVADTIRAASVLGHRFSHDLLQHYLVHLGRSDMVAVLGVIVADLQQEGLWVREPNTDPVTYRFAHSLIREALLGRLEGTEDAVRFNEAAARAKELDGSATERKGADWLADVAAHWRKAGDVDKAREFTLRRARVAEASWDLKAAQELYRSLEDELARANVVDGVRYDALLALGRLSSRQGELGPAEDLLQAAAGIARQLGNSRGEGKAMVILGKLHTWQSRHRDALGCFRQAITSFSSLKNTTHIDMAGLAEAQFGQAEVARVRGELASAETEFLKALDKARQSQTPEVEAYCLQGLGRADHVRGRLAGALANLQAARVGFGRCGLVIEEASAAADLALSQLYVHGRVEALKSLSPAVEALELANEQLAVAHARVHQGIVQSRGPDLGAAGRACEAALASFRSLHHTYGVAKATLLKAELRELAGDGPGASASGREALHLHDTIGDSHGSALSLLRLGEWSLNAGELDAGGEQLGRALEFIERGGLFLYRPATKLQLGRWEQGLGHMDAAMRLFTEAHNEANTASNQEVAARAAAHLGALALARGYLAEARAFLDTALKDSTRLGVVQIQGFALLHKVWLESLEGKSAAQHRALVELRKLRKTAREVEFGAEDVLSRAVKVVERLRGRAEAQHYSRVAAELVKHLHSNR